MGDKPGALILLSHLRESAKSADQLHFKDEQRLQGRLSKGRATSIHDFQFNDYPEVCKMKPSTTISSFALIGALVAGGSLLAPSFAGEGRTASAGEKQWLTIPQVHEKLEAAGYRNIEKIERERGGYEVRAIDRNGERVKLYVNPRTGELLDQRSGRRASDGSDKQRRYAADCNERRCRDDLPPKAASPAPATK
jgi:hypothetical protein